MKSIKSTLRIASPTKIRARNILNTQQFKTPEKTRPKIFSPTSINTWKKLRGTSTQHAGNLAKHKCLSRFQCPPENSQSD